MSYHGSVYALLTNDGVKIGYSNTPKKRIADLGSKFKIKKEDRVSFIGPGSRLARLLESDVHNIFIDKALGGEVFDIKFQDAVDEIEKTLIPSADAMHWYLSVPYRSKCELSNFISLQIRLRMPNTNSGKVKYISEITGISKPRIKSMADCRVDISRSAAVEVSKALGFELPD